MPEFKCEPAVTECVSVGTAFCYTCSACCYGGSLWRVNGPAVCQSQKSSVADHAPICAVGTGGQCSRGVKSYGQRLLEWPRQSRNVDTAARTCFRCGSLKHLVVECLEAVSEPSESYNGGPSSAQGGSPQETKSRCCRLFLW